MISGSLGEVLVPASAAVYRAEGGANELRAICQSASFWRVHFAILQDVIHTCVSCRVRVCYEFSLCSKQTSCSYQHLFPERDNLSYTW